MRIHEILNETQLPSTVNVWHGSDKNFDKFERTTAKAYVMMSEIEVERHAFFFAFSEDYASNFGRYVKEYTVQVGKCFDAATKQQAMQILSPMLEKGQDGKLYFTDGYITEPVTNESYADGSWLRFVFNNGNLNWEALDFPEVVDNIKTAGFNTVLVQEDDGEVTLAVFDSNRITPV